MTLSVVYDGTTRDMVQTGGTSGNVPDGAPDAEFKLSLSQSKTVTGIWIIYSSAGWTSNWNGGVGFMGVAASATGPLLNNPTTALNATGSQFYLYVSPNWGPQNTTWNVLVNFSDGTSYRTTVTVGATT